MVPTLPTNINPDGIYKSGQVCEALGIGSSTLWRYRRDGRIKAVHRPGSGENLYRGRDVINLWKFVY
ncbi:MAG: helix-turn-helix domain-containing protein [Bacteroidales bacterium]|nr:helix-turn-helix domain-containing protein [Bacteroidales bacterium]